MVDSGQKLEKQVKKILDESKGKTISWKNKQFLLLDWQKPMGQKTGEVKTDFLLVLEELNSNKIEMIKISGKQKNMGAVHNKLTAMWCETIYGKDWKKHIINQIKSIVEKDGFHKDKLVNFKKETITLGFRHEIMFEPNSGRERGAKTKPEIYPSVFWGEGCPKEYRDGKMKKLSNKTKQKLKKMNLTYEDNLDIVRDSGIPDYVLKADQSEIKSIDDILKRSYDIKEFAKDCKDDLIDAFFAQNYRINWKAECKHCGTEHRERYENVMNGARIKCLKKDNNSRVKAGKCPNCKKSGRKNSSSDPIQGTDRSMAVHVKWSIVNGKLDGVPILYENHQVDCEKVLVELRNCLLELGITDDSSFKIEMLKGKVTERTYNNLCNTNLN